MESKTILIFIGIVVIGIGVMVILQNYSNTKNFPPQAEFSPSPNADKWESKTDDQAAVTVEVTPLDLEPQSAEWKFNILMNTHTVELDQDIAAVAILIDDQGREYKPLKWEGAPPGGHHREGVLIFKAIDPAPGSIELRISAVGGVMRSFTWQI